jgi:arginine decarboxylase
LLATDPNCWVLHPGDNWHGFEGLPDGWCMLDPIKFGIVCPGMKNDGQLDANGIPADIVTAYLGRHGIVPSRTTDHMVLFLFSMGVTKGKWGTLLNTLLDFKADYDRNAPLAEVLPAVAAAAADRYAGMGLKDLGDEMWAHLRNSKQGKLQAEAYGTLPKPEMSPRRAFQRLMSGDAEKLPLAKMAGRVVAVGVIPYPPGIPIVMPGENIGTADGPWLTYLRTLQEYGHRFPGFAKEVEGTEERDGTYYIYCVKKTAQR